MQRVARKPEPERTRDVVLRLLQAGVSVRQIADALGITTQAVRKHLKALREAGDLPVK